VRAFRTSASYLGALIALGLAACDAESCVSITEGYTICYNDADEEVPCCGPAGEKYACPPDGGDDAAADAGDEADAGDDDGGPEAGSPGCPGQCVQGGGGWEDTPSFIWMGKETDTPPPPLTADMHVRWVDVSFAEPTCPACACAVPATGCVLPSVWNVRSTVCQDLSSPFVTPFDPPVGWDGTCTSTTQIPAGALCDGAPCVRSLMVGPPLVSPCVPEPALPAEGLPLPPPTRTKVIEYSAAQIGQCENGVERCVVHTPPGYRICQVGYGLQAEHPCPEGWPERHTGWESVEETRFCSPCSCSSPQGGFCEVRVKVYEDEACTNEQGGLVLTSNNSAKCTDLVDSTALASQTAEIITSEPGTCAPSGGEVSGEPFTQWPVTYCCLPDITPPQ